MAKSRLKIAAFATGIAALVAVPLAWADGYFPGFPIVGGASYCASQSTAGVPGTAAVCNATTPAGPTALTGAETVVADTHLASGQQPQTVAIDVTTLGAGPTQYSVPLTGTTITVLPGTRHVIIEPAGTLAALTLQLPAASLLTEGQKLGYCTTQIITAQTVTAGSGSTVMNAPTAMTVPLATGAASCVEWVYYAATTKWYRVQ